MLNIESQAIYDILCEITENSEVYKIVDADEINDKLPANITLTKVQLSQIIRDLKDREYVDIKYFTPDEYCLRVIKRIEPEEKASSAEETIAETSEDTAEESKERQLYGPKKTPATSSPAWFCLCLFWAEL